ncbi:MAG TPA: AI-2E family transporter [Acidimicrobiia bacterium]|jgi:predicted PurR-regulated permease PerM
MSVNGTEPGPWAEVPWRTIIAATLVVGSAIAAVAFVFAASGVMYLIALSGFIAIVLAPIVRVVQRRIGGHRVMASALVVLATVVIAIGIVALFLLPLRHQIAEILTDLPGTVRDAARGRGALGPLVRKLHLQKTVQDHEKTLHDWAANINKSSLSYLATAGEATIGVITVIVIAFFMLAETKNIANVATALITPARRELARQIGHDAASAISGYMIGNLLISLVAGTAAFLMFLIMGVPNAAALGAWIAFTDLIPLVGATIGAVAGVIAAFFHGNVAGIVSIVFFVVYQQFENSVLAPLVMHRTTRISPLTVLISVLVGVELLGYWGAVFAIPVAASLKVLASAAWQETHGGHALTDPADDESTPVADAS